MITDKMMNYAVDAIINFDKWLSWELKYTEMSLPSYLKERAYFHFVLNPPWRKCTECGHSSKYHVFCPGEYHCTHITPSLYKGKPYDRGCQCGYNTGRF